MSSDADYLKNYHPNTLYTTPGRHGSFATIVAENEEIVGEIEVTPRSRIAVKAFYVEGKKDFNSFKIIKLKFHKKYGWSEDEIIKVNQFDLANILTFLTIISTLDLSDAQKARVNLRDIGIEQLQSLLASSEGNEIIRKLSKSPDLRTDIYAVESKRNSLAEFESKLSEKITEPQWQEFFERNPWIFGHGLQYVFLNKASRKLETTTTGSDYNQNGNIADGFLRTQAEISQYVLVESKRADTNLLKNSEYRSGCWGVSSELSDAVTQVQKTTFDFARNRFRVPLKDSDGRDLDQSTYSIQPKSYLIIGSTNELKDYDDKIACFELYRRNLAAPEVITFDELFHRAKCIVDNLSG